jgi:hypothetical protein
MKLETKITISTNGFDFGVQIETPINLNKKEAEDICQILYNAMFREAGAPESFIPALKAKAYKKTTVPIE